MEDSNSEAKLRHLLGDKEHPKLKEAKQLALAEGDALRVLLDGLVRLGEGQPNHANAPVGTQRDRAINTNQVLALDLLQGGNLLQAHGDFYLPEVVPLQEALFDESLCLFERLADDAPHCSVEHGRSRLAFHR